MVHTTSRPVSMQRIHPGKVSEESQAHLRVREYTTNAPRSADAATSERILRCRGSGPVFVYRKSGMSCPNAWLNRLPDSCKNRHCGSCATWKRRLYQEGSVFWPWPHRLDGILGEFVPAYWVIPRRCYLSYEREVITLQFSNHPICSIVLRLGFRIWLSRLRWALQVPAKRHLLDFDATIRYPYRGQSEAGEIDRTSLCTELAMLLGTVVVSALVTETADFEASAANLGGAECERVRTALSGGSRGRPRYKEPKSNSPARRRLYRRQHAAARGSTSQGGKSQLRHTGGDFGSDDCESRGARQSSAGGMS